MTNEQARQTIVVAGQACEGALWAEAAALEDGGLLTAADEAEAAEDWSAIAFRAARFIPVGDHWSAGVGG